ncbi:hypothetical protein [Streptosporangium sp. NPDC023615]|uniref:hypothetical protein n=1 Tax=Streptosporangium sp. NPDC023615 TaxID=3154794 RepID=UPI0034320B90
MTLLTGSRLGRDAARWGARFYLRHAGLVVGLSMVPALQRFVSIRWGAGLPDAAAVTGEAITAASRVLLAYMIIKLAIVDDPALRPFEAEGRWRRLGRFAGRRRSDVAAQFLLLGAAFALFDILPETAIGAWVPEDARETVLSVLVSAKNPTVIAFTMVWMVGVARRMILDAPAPVRAPVSGTASPRD